MNRTRSNTTKVMCLHSSGSSGRQWLALAESLGTGYEIDMPDLQGYGGNPVWPKGVSLSLAEEAERLMPLLLASENPVHLVGHSYGGAVALRLALSVPHRVRSLSLYEPTLFSLLLNDPVHRVSTEEIMTVAGDLIACLERDETMRAAQRFVTYWGGGESWAQLSDKQRERLALRAHKAPADFHALFGADITAGELRVLTMPVLCLYGNATRAPARHIAERLRATLPNCELLRLPRLGHMAPMTRPAIVNALISEFLQRQARSFVVDSSARQDEVEWNHRTPVDAELALMPA